MPLASTRARSRRLQSALGLSFDAVCLGEIAVSIEGAKGVLLLTPTLLCYVADGASTAAAATWALELTDVLRVRAEAVGGGQTSSRRRSRRAQSPQLKLHSRTFESVIEVRPTLESHPHLPESPPFRTTIFSALSTPPLLPLFSLPLPVLRYPPDPDSSLLP